MKTRSGTSVIDVDMIDPLSLIECLFTKSGLKIKDDLVVQYWRHYRSAETQAGWAMWSEASEHAIPIALYGDACQVRQGLKMLGIWLSFPLWRPRTIRASRFLLTCIQEDIMVGRKSLDALWERVIWSCNILFVGKWPRAGPWGEALPEHILRKAGQDIVPNTRFCVTEIRGDWQWFKWCLSMRSSWKGGANIPICLHCEASTRDDTLYYDITPSSHVWETEYADVATFLVNQMPAKPSVMPGK